MGGSDCGFCVGGKLLMAFQSPRRGMGDSDSVKFCSRKLDCAYFSTLLSSLATVLRALLAKLAFLNKY